MGRDIGGKEGPTLGGGKEVQVEGPQNREISLFIGKHCCVGRDIGSKGGPTLGGGKEVQVEGPQNREISLFIGNTIGRFLWALFKAEKSQQSLLSCTISIRPAALTELQLYTLIQ